MGTDTFGRIIRHYREFQNVSLRDLADKVNISPTYLSLIERDKTPPPREGIILRLEEALKLEDGTLMERSKKVPDDIIDVMGRHPILCELVRVVSDRYMDDEIEGIIHGLE